MGGPVTLIGVKDVARILGISEGAVRARLHRGTIPPPHQIVSGSPLWKEAQIQAWKDIQDAK